MKAVFISSIVGIPFGNVDTVARCKLDAMMVVDDTHTDRDILDNGLAVLLALFNSKDDITLFACKTFSFAAGIWQYGGLYLPQNR